MRGENEHGEDVARLHALIRKALAEGELPKGLLDVSREELDALDPERVARLKALAKSEDLDALKEALETPMAIAGFNRGAQKEPEDAGLDEARRRVEERLRKKGQKDVVPPKREAPTSGPKTGPTTASPEGPKKRDGRAPEPPEAPAEPR